MKAFSLRARLLTGVAIIALVQIIAAFVITSITSDQLLDQIDERLHAAAAFAQSDPSAQASDELGALGGIGDVYQGILTDDGELITLNEVTGFDGVLPPPGQPRRPLVTGPTTVEAERGEVEYRLLAGPSGVRGTLILATPLVGYEFTMNRLIRLIVVTSAILMLVLGAVAWWVIRLGIAPVKRMTSAAEAIAAGDLSERIEQPHGGTEAGQLGLALNTMLGHIESSLDERTRAEERLRQFIADASHELRTPVATIRGYAELYQHGGLEPGPALDDAMRRTHQESERMSRLIADMLSLAKLDRRAGVRSERIRLTALTSDVVADARAANPDRTITITVPPTPVETFGDDDLLRQAVANLVGNAIVHAGAAATTTVTVARAEGHAVITVADDGDGMSETDATRATERFYRADPSRSRNRGGSGLGLAIVEGIAAAHDGTLTISSQPGFGTSVVLRLATAPERKRDQGGEASDNSQPIHS